MMQQHMDETLDREPSSDQSLGKPCCESAVEGSMVESNGSERNREFDLPIEKIKENYGRFRLIQPRKEGSMVKSLERFGQLSPVVVAVEDKGRHELIDGFKRLRALRKLGRDHVRARVMEGHARVLKAAMIQLNREGHSIMDMEEALVMHSLYREEGLNQVEIGVLVGRHKSWVCRRIGLVEKLVPEVVEHLRLGLIGVSLSRELIRLPRGNQKDVMECVLKNSLNSRQTRRLVDMALKHPRINRDLILLIAQQIQEDRTPPDSTPKAPSASAFDTALMGLEKRCESVTRGIRNGIFSEPSPRIEPVVKAIEETANHLKNLALKGAL